MAKEKPAEVSQKIKDSIERFNNFHKEYTPVTVEELNWDGMMGCYWFTRGNMFHGVELDGEIHT